MQFMGQQMQGQGLPPTLQQQQQQSQIQQQAPPARQLINMAQVNPLLVGQGQGSENINQNGIMNPNLDPQRNKVAQLARGGSITARLGGGGGVGSGSNVGMALQPSAPQVLQSSMQMQGLMQNQQQQQQQQQQQ